MFKTILVPLDGSARAEYALPMAAQLARHTGGMVVLVRVASIATDYWPTITSPVPSMMQSAVDGEMKEAATYLKNVASAAELAGIEITTTARYGVAAPVILSTVIDYHADLIVMCSHGFTGVAHVIMGSVAEKISRHASVPVLVVREKGGFPGINPAEISLPLRILVPLDGSSHAMAALEPAAALLTAIAAPAQKTALHLVRVVGPVEKRNEMQGVQRDVLTARRYLSQTMELIREGSIAPSFSKQHIPISWSVALDTNIAEAIIRVAENGEDVEGAGVFGGCDLIALATHGWGWIQHWTMGSVAERVLHATKRPILLIRPLIALNKQRHVLETEGIPG